MDIGLFFAGMFLGFFGGVITGAMLEARAIGAVDSNKFLHVVTHPYWYGKCRKCGFTASTEFFREIRYHDDADVQCPICDCMDVDDADEEAEE